MENNLEITVLSESEQLDLFKTEELETRLEMYSWAENFRGCLTPTNW